MSDAPPKPKDSYADLDWPRVRHEYETTDVSVRELSRRWGLRSENTLRRRLNAENWIRDQNAITAGLVTAAVARRLSPPEGAPEPTHLPHADGFGVFMDYGAFPSAVGPIVKQSEAALHEAEAVRTAAHIAKAPKTRAKRVQEVLEPTPAHTPAPATPAAEPQRTVTMPTGREIADAADLSTSRSLATIHADAIAVHVRIADRVVAVGLKLLEVIDDALGENADARGVARDILQISDKDGLASSVAAATLLLEKGVAQKRKALGMDIVAGRQPTPGGPLNGDAAGARPETAVREILDRLPIEALLAFRPAVAEVTKLRPEIVTIDMTLGEQKP